MQIGRLMDSIISGIAPGLRFDIVAECPTTRARVSRMTLSHSVVDTPVFMPVGTQGTLKALTPRQLQHLGCKIMLGNTYHLGHRPVFYYNWLVLFLSKTFVN